MELILFGTLATLALVYVAFPLTRANRERYYLPELLNLHEEKKLNYLQGQKKVIYDNIKDLEFEHEMGKLSDADFDKLRAGLMTEAANAVREIDEAQIRSDISDLIESEIRSRRKTN